MRRAKLKVCGTVGENIWASEKLMRSQKKKWAKFRFEKPHLHYPASNQKRVHIEPTLYLHGNRLKAKQKLKAFYGNLREKQFVALYKKSQLKDNLVGLLESRLDTVLYRIHMGPTPFAVRQMVSHGAFTVNGTKVSSKGYMLKPGDLIEVRKPEMFDLLANRIKGWAEGQDFVYPIPNHLEVNYSTLSCIFLGEPRTEEVFFSCPIDIQLVKEYYRFM